MIIIENDKLKAAINPLGAELQSVVRKDSGKEYMWQGDPTVWSGHAPILFPICGRLSKDSYTYNGERYSLPKHGFARRREFDLLEVEQERAAFVLRSDAKTKISYPFDFELAVSFALCDDKLKTVYTVVNTGDGTMYFSIGAHPAYSAEMGWKISFPGEYDTDTLTVDSDGLINGSRKISDKLDGIVLSEHIFDNDALIIPSPQFDSVTLTDVTGAPNVKMTFGNVPYLLFWAKPGAPFVCIEPWHGIPDDAGEVRPISDKKGMITLDAGASFSFETTAQFM